jgi:HK97 family phage prohead protease
MNKIFKKFKGVIKAINEKEYTVDVVVSTDSIDRDKEKIALDAFKKRIKFYKDHPVLVSSHSYGSLLKQIGEAQNIKVTENGLEARFKYYVNEGNPEADWGWILAQKGIAGYSIGFIPHGVEEKDFDKDGYRREYTDVELVEISQVLVPSNRDAVQGRRQLVQNLDDTEKELLDMTIKAFDDGQFGAGDLEDIYPHNKQLTEEEKQAREIEFIAKVLKIVNENIDSIMKSFVEKAKDDAAYQELLFGKRRETPQVSLTKDDFLKAVKEAMGEK